MPVRQSSETHAEARRLSVHREWESSPCWKVQQNPYALWTPLQSRCDASHGRLRIQTSARSDQENDRQLQARKRKPQGPDAQSGILVRIRGRQGAHQMHGFSLRWGNRPERASPPGNLLHTRFTREIQRFQYQLDCFWSPSSANPPSSCAGLVAGASFSSFLLTNPRNSIRLRLRKSGLFFQGFSLGFSLA